MVDRYYLCFVHRLPSGTYEHNNNIPTQFALKQNYPNPFNPTTTINYELRNAIFVELSIYNILGEKVADLVSENKNAGYHSVEWYAGNQASGIYFYMISAGSFQAIRKMILVR